ncbi:hypothetical protein PR202_ga15994 [Eleusine coracana subsp. coracana]|uniref:Uncharacterized protein n=1 Tax=Eleusine coracana subsp. coracana TaxID=191504 RepID=A0AAV5CLP7_ELECO|nr:hypothetical protein PR202_ga15994 [Eleusine coracana subsp. coracana]
MTESLNDKYLGLPALVGADRSDNFHHLIDRVRKRINGWREKTPSMGGGGGGEGRSPHKVHFPSYASLCDDGV